MAGSVIGALRATLGLDSAQFEKGLKEAKSGLASFGKFAGTAFLGVAAAGAAAATALGVAVKGAIDRADAMGEMAQSIGVSVEALSSLGFAAKMSGSDIDTLGTGLRKLSQNMLTVAQGSTGPVATAFQALGIAVQNADGTLRSSDQILLAVADKFSRMEDGALKTALAVQMFGRSGAELIPMLNQGSAGIGALTAEADRLGITLSGTTANAAGEVNDAIDRLGQTFDGVVNKIMEAALPALLELSETLSSPEFAESAQEIGTAIVSAMDAAAKAVIAVVEAFNSLRNAMEWANTHDMFGNKMADPKPGSDAYKKGLWGPDGANQELRDQLNSGQTSGPGDDFFKGIFGGAGDDSTVETAKEATAVLTDLSVSINDVATSSKAAAGGASSLKAVMSEGKAVFESTRTPSEAYALELDNLNRLLQAGAIDQDTYNRAVTQAQEGFTNAEQSGRQLASTLSSGLADMFKGIVTGSQSATDAIGNLLGSLADLLINQAFSWLVSSIFPGGGIKIPGNANGTSNWRGGLTMVGERGPELVNLPRGSSVIPNRALMTGGGGEIFVHASMEVVNGNLVPLITDVSGQVSGQQVKSYDKQLPNRMRDINQRFG